jgi:uncharacterized protein (TIGR02246 family)
MRVSRALTMALFALTVVGASWLYGQQGKMASLTTQDYIDIQQLYARYNHTLDAGDAEGYAALFTPDGSFNNNVGHDALVQFVKNRTAGDLRHWNTNLLITPTPEGADGTVYLMFLNVSTRPPTLANNAAKYTDSMVKTSQGWRFKKRQTRPEGPPPAPPAAQAPVPR